MAALLILGSVFCCGYGLALIFAKDLAWGWTEWSNTLRGVASARTEQWDAMATVRGALLLVLALAFLCGLPAVTPRPPDPMAGVRNLTIDGHPATPEQQREFEEQFHARPANN